MMGGIGMCGRPFCCNQFLSDFSRVTIKSAKDQGLPLNPVKISGVCGILMCCLNYEQETYEELSKKLPKVGAQVETPKGKGVVAELSVLTSKVKVKFVSDDTTTFETYDAREIKWQKPARPAGEKKQKPQKEKADGAVSKG